MSAVDQHGRAPVVERLRDAAAARAEGIAQAEYAADPRVIEAIDAAIEKAIASGRRFSANTIRDQFPVASEGLIAGRFNSYANRKVDGHRLMECVGRTPSSLKSTHHHEIKVWLGWEAHQALHRIPSAS